MIDRIQTELFPLDDYVQDDLPPVWGWDENLGTENLGTEILVPKSKLLVPKFDNWQPPIGTIEQKPVGIYHYWYWRYYDNRGKKASLYLGKDYNRAVAKCQKIGVPTDAKPPKTSPQTDPETAIEHPTLYTPKPPTANRSPPTNRYK